jgi:dimethylaniline monooxygenase (N-oxide forming)
MQFVFNLAKNNLVSLHSGLNKATIEKKEMKKMVEEKGWALNLDISLSLLERNRFWRSMARFVVNLVSILLTCVLSVPASVIWALLFISFSILDSVSNLIKSKSVEPLPNRKKVAVIGAGPVGLVTTKELMDFDHDVSLFERSDKIGGVFAHYYRCGRLTSSSVITAFGSYYPDNLSADPKIWTFDEYTQYLESFAEHFNIMDRTRLETTVTNVEENWDEETQTMKYLVRSSRNGIEHAEIFDHVAVCVGIAARPKNPVLKGIENFDGKIMHSFDFKSPSDFAGKNVLCIGLGESGSDIVYHISKVANTSAISTRKGPGYVIPRHFGGHVADLDTTRAYHGLPKVLAKSGIINLKRKLEGLWASDSDDFKSLAIAGQINAKRGISAFRRFGTKNTAFCDAIMYNGTQYFPGVDYLTADGVTFVDGSHFKCDTIVNCTGFGLDFPFLKSIKGLQKEDGCTCITQNLFLNMVRPSYGLGIVFIGLNRPAIGSVMPLAEMSARYFTSIISGLKQIPSEKEMRIKIEENLSRNAHHYPVDAKKITVLIDFLSTYDDYSKYLGCEVDMLRLFSLHPKLWYKVLFGPLMGIHYRIFGHGKMEMSEVEKVLELVPTMPLPVLLIEFLTLSYSRIANGILGRSQLYGLSPDDFE